MRALLIEASLPLLGNSHYIVLQGGQPDGFVQQIFRKTFVPSSMNWVSQWKKTFNILKCFYKSGIRNLLKQGMIEVVNWKLFTRRSKSYLNQQLSSRSIWICKKTPEATKQWQSLITILQDKNTWNRSWTTDNNRVQNNLRNLKINNRARNLEERLFHTGKKQNSSTGSQNHKQNIGWCLLKKEGKMWNDHFLQVNTWKLRSSTTLTGMKLRLAKLASNRRLRNTTCECTQQTHCKKQNWTCCQADQNSVLHF